MSAFPLTKSDTGALEAFFFAPFCFTAGGAVDIFLNKYWHYERCDSRPAAEEVYCQ